MKGKAHQQTAGAAIEPGTYEATLERITAWTSKKYQSEDYEPSLTFVWNLGEDDLSNPIRVYDSFVRIPLDREGYPVLNEDSKLYNRVSALYGSRFDPKAPTLDWEIVLPEAYDSPEGLLGLPRFEERNEDGFRPVEVKSLKVNGRELLGATCQVVVGEKNGYNRVSEATPAPRRPKPARKDEELPV
jgi:hypothetical protein